MSDEATVIVGGDRMRLVARVAVAAIAYRKAEKAYVDWADWGTGDRLRVAQHELDEAILALNGVSP
ncbi:MAG TPA: hypothetical protein VM686_33865 [Polyangiaceae bacterium]|nr:hypothetical protein [Polyangiaceae bacterium]